MIRKIKALGLAFVAVFAMSSLVASGAGAANFTASSYPASLSGGQTTKFVFTVGGQKVECSEASFTGSLVAASSQLTMTPSYSKCTAFGFVGASIHRNGCDYVYTASSSTAGSVHIQCPTGASIVITGGSCVTHIGAQTPTTPTVDYKNEPNGKFLVTWTVSGIHTTVTHVGPFCTLTAGANTMSIAGSSLIDAGMVQTDVGP